MAETKVSLKLLVDTQSKRVLFGEAGKPFVDFLFHIMSLPVGTVVKLMNADGMVGSLGALYQSIESLSSEYFETDLHKDAILKPKAPVSVPLLSFHGTQSSTPSKFYKCRGRRCRCITDSKGISCYNNCGFLMSKELTFISRASTGGVASSSSGDGAVAVAGGYVKGVVTYMVMDDLKVKPMSTVSGITLMNKFHVRDVSSLVEKEVEVGLKEGLAMLKASLETKAVLTTVFIRK